METCYDLPTWLFYTYNDVGENVIVPITAIDRVSAIEEFDRVFGENIEIDFIIKSVTNYETASSYTV